MKTLRTIALAALFTVSSTAALFACKGGGCGDDHDHGHHHGYHHGHDVLDLMTMLSLTKALTQSSALPTVPEVDLFLDGLGKPDKRCDVIDAVMGAYGEAFSMEAVMKNLHSVRLELPNVKKAAGFLKELGDIRTAASGKAGYVADPILDQKIKFLGDFIVEYQKKSSIVVDQAKLAFNSSITSYMQTGYSPSDSCGPCGKMVYAKPRSCVSYSSHGCSHVHSYSHVHKAGKCGY